MPFTVEDKIMNYKPVYIILTCYWCVRFETFEDFLKVVITFS